MNDEERESFERIKKDPTYREISLLRIIEKQQKEIEHWKKGMKIVEKDKQNHIDRLDRQIDLMAGEIIKLIYNSFSEIENDLPYVDDSIKQTKINVIEYFKNKVEEDK